MVCPVKAMVFPVVVYRCESWTIKKAECQRIDAFEQWCWRRLLRIPWTSRKSVLNIHWKGWCWSWSSNTLATWFEELTHWKRPWCWKDWRQEEKGMTEDKMVGWHHQFYGHEFEQAPWVGDGQRSVMWCSSWGRKELDTTGWLNWTEGKASLSISCKVLRQLTYESWSFWSDLHFSSPFSLYCSSRSSFLLFITFLFH